MLKIKGKEGMQSSQKNLKTWHETILLINSAKGNVENNYFFLASTFSAAATM